MTNQEIIDCLEMFRRAFNNEEWCQMEKQADLDMTVEKIKLADCNKMLPKRGLN